MTLGSPLVRELNGDLSSLEEVECQSYYSPLDQVVLPARRGVLPVGPCTALPPTLHQHILSDPRSLEALRQVLLAP